MYALGTPIVVLRQRNGRKDRSSGEAGNGGWISTGKAILSLAALAQDDTNDTTDGRVVLRQALQKLILIAAMGVMGAFATACREASGNEPTIAIAGGNADRGKIALSTYGCGSCHTIPGIRTAKGTVGPPLFFWSKRTYIAGEVPNTPDYLIRWIQVPQAIEPGTAMPNLGVSDGAARDMAAYLYTLR